MIEVVEENSEFADEVNTSLGKESSIYVIANDYLELKLTNLGAAIQEIRFLKAKRGNPDTFVFNQNGQVPSLALSFE